MPFFSTRVPKFRHQFPPISPTYSQATESHPSASYHATTHTKYTREGTKKSIAQKCAAATPIVVWTPPSLFRVTG